jgi:hypothetical protein
VKFKILPLREIVAKMDGDGQMDPNFLTALRGPIVADSYAYTKGNRFCVRINWLRCPDSSDGSFLADVHVEASIRVLARVRSCKRLRGY